MLALRVHGFESRAEWRLEEVDVPIPAAGQVRVQVAASAVSFVDLLFADGRYQVRPTLPLVPGTEFSGVVESLGPGADGSLAPGQRVAGTALGGAWGELACARACDVHPLPDGVDLVPAALLPVTFATALYALGRRAALVPGETVLVLAAAGGVGSAAVQVARALGARVIAAASSEPKRHAALAAGAHAVVDSSAADWRAQVQQAAPEGIDVVFDPVGGALTETAFRTLRWGGRHLVIGFADGSVPSLRANLALLKGSSLVGVDIRQFRERTPELARANLGEVIAMMAKGELRPPLAGVYPARDWAQAIELASARATAGRVLLDWRGAGA